MNAQSVFALFYIATMSLAAPIIWAVTIPAITRLVEAKQWLPAIGVFAIFVGSAISWLNNIGLPAAEQYVGTPLVLSYWDFMLTFLVWPVAILTVRFLYKEWRKIKSQTTK
jgi:acyl-CoA hydrolase